MSKFLILSVLIFLTSTINAQLPKIFINYVSHSEDNYLYLEKPEKYYLNRIFMRQFALDCQSNGAKWSIGSDYITLQAIDLLDTGNVVLNTNNKNLLQWLQEDMDVSCEPHSHETLYTYADVAYLHKALGVTPEPVVSGFLYRDTTKIGTLWPNLQDTVYSNIEPSYYWVPEILWGAGTKGHINDPLFFGVWKPDSIGTFLTHTPNNHLIYYGHGCKINIEINSLVSDIIKQIDELIDAIKNGIVPSNGFYCTSLFIKESDFFKPGFLVKLDSITSSINQRVDLNHLEWKHIIDVIDEWKTSYNSKAFFVSCDLNTVYNNVKEKKLGNLFSLYPNPFKNSFTISPSNNEVQYYAILYNVMGNKLLNTGSLKGKYVFDLSNEQPGMYLIQIKTDNQCITLKCLKNSKK